MAISKLDRCLAECTACIVVPFRQCNKVCCSSQVCLSTSPKNDKDVYHLARCLHKAVHIVDVCALHLLFNELPWLCQHKNDVILNK